MDEMPKHPRLCVRNGTFYHRAAIPVDIKATYPKKEEKVSLNTKDPKEAMKRVRVAAVEADRRFEEHRQKLGMTQTPTTINTPTKVDELTLEQLELIKDLYYRSILESDDEFRCEEEFHKVTPLGIKMIRSGEVSSEQLLEALETGETESLEEVGLIRPTFEEKKASFNDYLFKLKQNYAKGVITKDVISDAEDMLCWDEVNLELVKGSPSWDKLYKELQITEIKANEAILKRYDGDAVRTPLPPLVTVNLTQKALTKSSFPKLSEVAQDYYKEKVGRSWRKQMENDARIAIQTFIEVCGDKPLDHYRKSDARAYKDVFMDLCTNWRHRRELKDLHITKAAQKARQLNLQPMAVATINKPLILMHGFWEWAARQHDEPLPNLFKGLRLPRPQLARHDRNPFTSDELKCIFHSPLYTGCESLRSPHQAGNLIPKESALYWVPLISLYSGMRLDEILQLRVEDIMHEAEGSFYYIEIKDDGDTRRVKSKSSLRKIPIHPALIKAGLLSFVQQKEKQGESRLFPPDKTTLKDKYSSYFSQRFSRFLKQLGIKHRKNSFHSFRHSFEDACLNADLPEGIINTLQGHSTKGMIGTYGSGYSLRKLNEAVKKIKYQLEEV